MSLEDLLDGEGTGATRVMVQPEEQHERSELGYRQRG